MRTAGVVLAAGEGRRMGGPKALIHGSDGATFVQRAAELLLSSGCTPVLVTVGALAQTVRAHVPSSAHTVHVPGWGIGPGAGLSRVLEHPGLERADALLITLVDLPFLDGLGIRAVLAHASPNALIRAVEHGRPGHPVLIGRDHFTAAAGLTRAGHGLKALLATPETVHVEVTGATCDVDRPEDLPAGAHVPVTASPVEATPACSAWPARRGSPPTSSCQS